MVTATGPFRCTCKADKGKVIHCKPHAATEYLLAALEYAREFIASHSMEKTSDENLKREILLPYLDNLLAKTRNDE